MSLAVTKFVSRLDLSNARVDRENGIIKGVSLLSIGDVKGHKQFSDKKTLEQIRDCGKQYSGGLRVKWNPNTFNHGEGSVVGCIPANTFRVKGDQTIGDIHVLKHFPHKDYLFEMAEDTPEIFGISLEFSGVPEEIEGKRFARCDQIFAAAIVDIPAANPTGLFRAGDNENEGHTMTPDEIKQLGTAVATAVAEVLKPSFEKTEKAINQFRAEHDGDNEPPTDDEKKAAGVTAEDSDADAKKKVNAWRAKDGNQPVTKRDLMQFFRTTGNRAARTSGDGEGTVEHDKTKTDTPFEQRVIKYRAVMGEAKALLRAKQDDPKGYNEWAEKGRPDIKSTNEE